MPPTGQNPHSVQRYVGDKCVRIRLGPASPKLSGIRETGLFQGKIHTGLIWENVRSEFGPAQITGRKPFSCVNPSNESLSSSSIGITLSGLIRAWTIARSQDQPLPSRLRIGIPPTSPSTKPSAASCITAIGKTPPDLPDRSQPLACHDRSLSHSAPIRPDRFPYRPNCPLSGPTRDILKTLFPPCEPDFDRFTMATCFCTTRPGDTRRRLASLPLEKRRLTHPPAPTHLPGHVRSLSISTPINPLHLPSRPNRPSSPTGSRQSQTHVSAARFRFLPPFCCDMLLHHAPAALRFTS